jgi:hypothetical protein
VTAGLAVDELAEVFPVGKSAFGGGRDGLMDGDVDELAGVSGVPHPEGSEEADDSVFVADSEAVLTVGSDRREVVVVVSVAHHGAAEGELD